MFSKTGLLAIRALTVLARLDDGEWLGVNHVAEAIGAPPNYLGKLLQRLARDGLVESQKGLGGGFRLSRDARSIRLLDVVEPIEQVSRWENCVLGRPECSEKNPCALHDTWARLRGQYLTMLTETNIADLMRDGTTALTEP